jgi:antagonist of KipI
MPDQVTLSFKKAGMLTTVQDFGRTQYQHLGIPIGGVMDKKSAKEANRLVGNQSEAPVFEITMMGPEIEFSEPCQIAITGANMSATLNRTPIENNLTINVPKGGLLKFGRLIAGCRVYLSIGGKMNISSWLGSSGAINFEAIALTPNSLIKKGSSININEPSQIDIRSTTKAQISKFKSEISVRVIEGPEYNYFSKFDKDFFFDQKFEITINSNRMGCRITPSIPNYKQSKELISSGIVSGTIQVTNSGQPIILMADAQTIGGYLRIANIVSSDLDKIAQLKPGDLLSFELISLN